MQLPPRKSPAPRPNVTRRSPPPTESSGANARAARPRSLAKLTPPRLYDALPRPRLFTMLDEARARPIVWICAPPGAGKTTLVASYVDARRLPCLWFQVDVADGDPATFVHYIRTAAEQLVGDQAESLPLFNSEPQQDLARFGRGFFRDLFGILPVPSVLVLDNFHEARTTAAQRNALAQGLEEVPEGVNVLIISRSDPPPEFARLVAGRQIARLDPGALRCTADEASAMLGRAQPNAQTLKHMTQQIDGWAAALVLLREHLSRDDATLDESVGEGKDAIFQYFAGEIFNGMSAPRQRVLMLCAMLPSVTQADAIALADDESAGEVLEDLYRRHLFLDRRRADVSTYHFHALFREFLLAQAQRRLTSDERRAAAVRGGALLASRGQASDALALFRDAREWESMRELIHANALEWARQGRAQTLSEWIEALPRAMREADAWLEYWFGRAWIFLQPQRGRPSLARAYGAFKRAGDVRGQALALNTIVTGYYYEWATFLPLDDWLPEFEQLLSPARATELDADSELRARAAYVITLLFRRPDHADLAPCAERLQVLLQGDMEVNARMMAASTLFNYLNWETKGDSAEWLVSFIQPFLADPGVTPLMQVWWRTHLAFWHYINGRYDPSTATIAEARSIADRYGLQAYLFEFDHAQASALISQGAYAEAKTLIDGIEQRLSATRRMDWAYFHHLRANLRQRLGEYALAVQDAERAIALARDTGLPPPQLPHFLARLAHSRLSTGDREGGMRALDDAIAHARGTDRATFEQQRELVEIGFAIGTSDEAAAATRLARVLGDYRARGQVVFLRNRPDLGARLCDFALEHDIEPEYARMLIVRNALQAPADAGERWPFAVRVRVLGGFELLRENEPVRFSGKAQQRPLDLLKALVAMGGAGVDAQQLMTALWPEADGAAAKTSFDTTLFRLRKLLEVDNALLLTAGKLSLNRELCWADVWAYEAALDAAHAAVDRDASPRDLAHAAARLLGSYRGNLLGGEDPPWGAKPRDALRSRFVRAVLSLGERLERAREFAPAIDLYRRALEADNLSEPLYRGLMRSLVATGDHAEALSTFRRCRELLSIVLGLKPAPDTERLYREIVAAQA